MTTTPKCCVFMDGLARVFFKVGTHQAHGFVHSFFTFYEVKRHLTALHHRNFKLTDLIALRQVGIKIVFARKNAALGHMRIHSQAQLNGTLHRALVHDRQGTRQGHVHRAGLGVGLSAKCHARPAEDFAVS